MTEPIADLVGQYWSDRTLKTKRLRPPQIRAHASMRICGIPAQRTGEAVMIEMQRRYFGRRFERAISVGAGTAAAEIDLLAHGLVGHFDIFELAEERVKRAGQAARKGGVPDRMTFHNADAFAARHRPYDLVYWRNALHHMPDALAAVEWSRRNLAPGGVFVMEEYTGPNRLQYTPRQMALCDHALAIVPDLYFYLADGKKIGRKCVPPSRKELMRRDPSEAPDSEAILPALAKVFPNASVTHVGGLIYFAGLRRIIQNFNDAEDRELFETLLQIDGHLADRGESLYHFAIAEG